MEVLSESDDGPKEQEKNKTAKKTGKGVFFMLKRFLDGILDWWRCRRSLIHPV